MSAHASSRERWRRIPAWHHVPAAWGEASSEGRVRTVDRRLTDGREAGGQVLTPTLDRDGKRRVKVRGRWVRVATLVALAWHGPPEVRHLGDGPQDDRPAKLAWGSRRENERDKQRETEEGRKEAGNRPLPMVTGW